MKDSPSTMPPTQVMPGNGPGRPEGALWLQRASRPRLAGLGEPGWRGSHMLQLHFFGVYNVDLQAG